MIQCDCNIKVVSRIQLVVNKHFFHLQFFDLIVKKYEINNIPKCTPFWHEMFKIASVSGAPPRPRSGSLRRSPKTLYSRYTIGASCLRQSKLRTFGACNFPDSQVYMRKTLKFPSAQSPPARTYSTSIFFTSNMSHYLKFFKICPS